MPSSATGWVNMQEWMDLNKAAGEAQTRAAEGEAASKAAEAQTWANAANKAASAEGKRASETSQWGEAQKKAAIAQDYYSQLGRPEGVQALTHGSFWDSAVAAPGSTGGWDKLQQYMSDVDAQSANRLAAAQRNQRQASTTRAAVDLQQQRYGQQVQGRRDAERVRIIKDRAARGVAQDPADLQWYFENYQSKGKG